LQVRLLSLLTIVLIFGSTGCEHIGPRILVRNTTEFTVSVISTEEGAPPNWPLGEFRPSAEKTLTSYTGISNYKDRIEAWNDEGKLVFCRDYASKDVRDGQVEVVIVADDIRCQFPPVRKPTRPPAAGTPVIIEATK
jgi:hypothetical protein